MPPPTRRLPAVLLAAVLLVAACQSTVQSGGTDPRATAPLPTGSPSGAGTAGTGGTLRWGIVEPAGITPATATSPDGKLIVDALFDSLTRVDEDGRARAAAAWSWGPDPDAATWVFRLRADAQWHDGTPVTAHDFVDGWSAAVRHDLTAFHLADVVGYEQVRAGDAERLAGLTALDAHTLRVTLDRPRAEFPVVAGHPSLAPSHPSAPPAGVVDRHPIGNGPFQMAEAWAPEQFIRLVAASRWRNAPSGPHLDEVVFRSMDPDAAFVAFQQGRVDVAEVPPGALQRALELFGDAPGDGYTGPGVLRGDMPVLYHLGFDLSQPPFDDVEVRRAVSMAIDRTALSRAVLQGNVRPARGIVPPALPGSRPMVCEACGYDLEQARRLFAERDITELTLWFNPDGGHGHVAQELRTQLARAGVAVRFEAPTGPAFADAVDDGRAAWFRAGWAAEHLSVQDPLLGLLPTMAVGNLGGYSAADVDALLNTAAAELHRERRLALLHQAEDLALGRDQVIVPLFTYRLDLLVSDRLAQFRVDPMRRVDLSTVRMVSEPPQ